MHRWFAALTTLAFLALILGLVAPSAQGSCAGPQISIRHGATRLGHGTYRVAPGARITLYATNLVRDCGDARRGGCSRAPEPSPATDVAVIVRQGSRSWRLGRVSGHGEQHVDSLVVTLPAQLSAGSATLVVDTGQVALKVTHG